MDKEKLVCRGSSHSPALALIVERKPFIASLDGEHTDSHNASLYNTGNLSRWGSVAGHYHHKRGGTEWAMGWLLLPRSCLTSLFSFHIVPCDILSLMLRDTGET